MPSNSKNLHFQLYEAFKRCYTNYTGTKVQEEVNKLWNSAKTEYASKDKTKFQNFVLDEIKRLNVLTTKKKSSMLFYLTNVSEILFYKLRY